MEATQTYSIESVDELVQKVEDELDLLEGIYDGEGVVLSRAEEIPPIDDKIEQG